VTRADRGWLRTPIPQIRRSRRLLVLDDSREMSPSCPADFGSWLGSKGNRSTTFSHPHPETSPRSTLSGRPGASGTSMFHVKHDFGEGRRGPVPTGCCVPSRWTGGFVDLAGGGGGGAHCQGTAASGSDARWRQRAPSKTNRAVSDTRALKGRRREMSASIPFIMASSTPWATVRCGTTSSWTPP